MIDYCAPKMDKAPNQEDRMAVPAIACPVPRKNLPNRHKKGTKAVQLNNGTYRQENGTVRTVWVQLCKLLGLLKGLKYFSRPKSILDTSAQPSRLMCFPNHWYDALQDFIEGSDKEEG